MARTSIVFDIKLNQITWVDAALAIWFSYMKNDKLTEKPRNPRHIYCNAILAFEMF